MSFGAGRFNLLEANASSVTKLNVSLFPFIAARPIDNL